MLKVPVAPYFHHVLILLLFLLTRAIFKGVGQAETLADTKQGENRDTQSARQSKKTREITRERKREIEAGRSCGM